MKPPSGGCGSFGKMVLDFRASLRVAQIVFVIDVSGSMAASFTVDTTVRPAPPLARV